MPSNDIGYTNSKSSGSFLIFTITFVLLTCIITISEACSCLPTHPQQQFCQSDFVILARIKKNWTYKDDRIYKVRIRKEYKMSEKAVTALKSGRLLTSQWDSMCGVNLETGKLYAISGKVVSLQARINLCASLIEPWEKLSRRQRKGLNRMYKQGCNCKIKTCFSYKGCPKPKDFCIYNFNIHDREDCQRTHGICLRSASNQCIWAKNKMQMACMKNQTSLLQPKSTMTTTSTATDNPPLTISLWSG